jgi:hypothetical protein
LVITVGNHILIPDVPGQTVQAFVSGGDEVAGVNLFVQVGDGGPELADYGLPPGTDGPAISAVDLKTGTIFDGTPDSQFEVGSIPQVVNYGFVISEPDATVSAEGVLVTLTIDMSGFSSGSWELLLGDVLPGLGPLDTDFAPTPATILNGSITAALPGDANLDGQVNDLDASVLAAHWQQQSGMNWEDGDFNDDGIVNDADASILAAHWQQTWEGEGTAAVPEPAAIILCIPLCLAGVLIYRCSRGLA